VRAYFALRKLRKPESFFSWLLGIARRVAKETHRANRQGRGMETLRSEPAASVPEDGSANDRITRAVALLPDVYRQVVLLRYYAGRSCAEIGRDLDVPLGTVTKRLSRAYSLLRASLREQNQPENVETQS
jgi:RNA polymerase sigma-70 factor (ECF subfamily)